MLSIDKSLGDKLRVQIRSRGCITFRDWMETALYDPTGGYYCRLDHLPWGRQGDYRTSAERSTLFSATFARYFAKIHAELGSPQTFTIVDCGAGSGDFACVVLESLHRDSPEVGSKVRYVIDERNTRFQEMARSQLNDFEIELKSLDAMTAIDAGVIFANELLDAFPVHRVIQKDGLLQEFYVTLDDQDNFEWVLKSPSTPELDRYLNSAGMSLCEGQIAEINLDAGKWLVKLAEKLKSGFVILVDYGAEADELFQSTQRLKGTLRSFRHHELGKDLLATPGDQDLTTTIDWTFVKRLSKQLGFEVVAFQRQDKFLLEAGLLDELELRTRSVKSEAEQLKLRTEAREMVLPSGMAGSFHVLVLKK